MTDQELRKLNRLELLELLTKQQERIEELEEKVDELEERLQDREIRIAESGSIAEAALELTGIFEKAQEAADLYLANVRSGGVRQSAPAQVRRPAGRTASAERSAAADGRTVALRSGAADGRTGSMRSAVQSGTRPAYSQDTAPTQAVQPQRKGGADPAEEDDDGWLDWID